MIRKFQLSLLSMLMLLAFSARAQPYLKQQGTTQQLHVDKKPFLILGGELGNSTASDLQAMHQVWPRVKSMGLNTILAPVYWELLEPEEGKFNYTLVDSLVENARNNNIKLVILWFGAWKNSMSCYAPAWVKTNQQRFPRAAAQNKQGQEILSPFSANNLQADILAFKALMRHIRKIDAREQTVLMVQVENEIGMLPDARDHSTLADAAFGKAVPAQLLQYLLKKRQTLLPELQEKWALNGYKTEGNWEAVFGRSLSTDELFMAWYYARFIDQLAAAGKEEYNLPMYLNAALNYRKGAKPGEYPSAGPLPHIMEIWKAGAPAINLLAPDFYNPDFKYWNKLFVRHGNPLFIPEIKFEQGVGPKALYAMGHHSAMGFSPFSIENGSTALNAELGSTYELLAHLKPLLLQHQGKETINGVLFDKLNNQEALKMGDYLLTFSHELTLGWSPKAKTESWPLTGALVIQLAPDEFIVAGTGVVVTFKPMTPKMTAGITQIDEGRFEDGRWIPGLRMNGDQSHQGRHLRIPEGEYSIQRVKLYSYQ